MILSDTSSPGNDCPARPQVAFNRQLVESKNILTEIREREKPVVLYGRIIERNRRNPEWAVIECPCACGAKHRHGWNLADGYGVKSPRGAHCPPGEKGYYNIGYLIALDPKAKHEIDLDKDGRPRVPILPCFSRTKGNSQPTSSHHEGASNNA